MVSVIVPVYKKEDTLEYCLDALIRQTYKNFEIIVVDDGSPDRCPQICDNYATKDARIIVKHQQNQGVSVARNIGLQLAKGKFISFVDADDEVCENYIEQMLKNIGANDMLVTSNHFESGNELKVITSEQAIDQMFKNDNFGVNVWGKLFERELAIKNRFLPEVKIGEDMYWLYQILEEVNTVVVLDKCLYKQKISKYNSGCKMAFEKVYDSVILVNDIIEHRKEYNLPIFQSIQIALVKRCLGLFMRCSYDEVPKKELKIMKRYVREYMKAYKFNGLGVKYTLAGIMFLINTHVYARFIYHME